MMISQRLLDIAKPTIWRETFDSLDLAAVRLHREHQARACRHAVHQHRASPANSVLATDMRSRQRELMAQKVRKVGARLDCTFELPAVDHHLDGMNFRHGALLRVKPQL